MTKHNVLALLLTPDDCGLFLRWKSKNVDPLQLQVAVTGVVLNDQPLSLLRSNAECPVVPLVDKSPKDYRVLAIGPLRLSVSAATKRLLHDKKVSDVSVQLEFLTQQGASVEPGRDFEVVNQTALKLQFAGDDPDTALAE